MSYKIGIDVGGTFTDFLLVDEKGNAEVYKVATIPADPSMGVMSGLQEMAVAKGINIQDFLQKVDMIVHGTTITTNAMLTGKYAKIGFLTTKGFRDILYTRKGLKKRPFDVKEEPVLPLVPRALIRVVEERIDYQGNELIPLNEEDVYSAIEVFDKAKVEAIAISLLFSFLNSSHEQRLREIIEQELPRVYVSQSSEVLPQVRFYERNSTTALNACVGPVLKTYIESLLKRLKQSKFTGVLRIMQSNGGVMSPELALRFAANTLSSGPAAGPKAGVYYGGIHGLSNVITIDMGGTSFDACLIKDGKPETTTEAEISDYRIALPQLAVHSIGAGGGSIAWIDPGGILRVGPNSAGAEPGPASYDMGGEEPTVTDADLVLGYLNPDYFLGGKKKLYRSQAERAIREKVANKLNIELIEAASGIYEIINSNMAQGVRLVSVSKGIDPRGFALIIAGGAGPVHGTAIAKELGIRLLMIPKESAVFCATGMLISDLRHDMVRSQYMLLTEEAMDVLKLNALLQEMHDIAYNTLIAERIPPERMRLSYSADLRYLGQPREIEIPLPIRDSTFSKEDLSKLWNSFHQSHENLYGYSMPSSIIELINLRVSAEGITDKPTFRESPFVGEDTSSMVKEWREAYLDKKWVKVPIYDGTRMGYGNKLTGPAIIEEPTTTILVTADWDLACDCYGNYIMHPKGMTVEEVIKELKQNEEGRN